MSTQKTNAQVWQPDSDTVIIREQTKINPATFKLCCKRVESLMSRENAQNHSEAICSYLDEFLSRNVGTIDPTAKTLFGLDNIAYQNTDKRPILARIIADNVRLYLDGKLADTAKEIAFRCIDNWLASIEAQEPTPTATDERQGNQTPARQEPSTKRAKKAFAKAVKAKYMEKTTTGYKWLYDNKASLSYFVFKVYSPDNTKMIPFTALEKLFGVKRLDRSVEQALEAKKPQSWREGIDKLLEKL